MNTEPNFELMWQGIGWWCGAILFLLVMIGLGWWQCWQDAKKARAVEKELDGRIASMVIRIQRYRDDLDAWQDRCERAESKLEAIQAILNDDEGTA